jgi:hypothetical protein
MHTIDYMKNARTSRIIFVLIIIMAELEQYTVTSLIEVLGIARWCGSPAGCGRAP